MSINHYSPPHIVSETAETWTHLPAIFLGIRVPGHPADKPLPEERVDCAGRTVDERTPARRT